MAAEPEQDLKLEIAHVLTIDVVAYSTLLIHEQSRVMAELTKVVRNTPRFRTAEADGKLTRLPTGDGMALVFFGDPEAPIECAMQIGTALKARPEIQLRMGIHSGPINQILDVNDRSNVAGAGIDMAQRVMDCGDAGHILVSKRVADDLAPYPRWNRYLYELGEFEVKHGRRISVFNFCTDALGNPALPRKLQGSKAAAARSQRSRRRFIIAGGAIALALFLLGWALLVHSSKQLRQAIAVLPFVDLSQAKDQEYFSDGITEQIIGSLGKIRGLLVVARSSSFAFKNKNQDIREIGKLLQVTHIIEGSVSRAAGRVRVDAHLIDVKNGYRLWGQSYDSTEQDALSLQSDVAQKVANALEVQLQLKEATQIAKLPTQDPEAYDLYLRGRYLLNKRTADSIRKARELFEQAVLEDPGFAAGHAGIADSFILLGEYGVIPAEEASRQAWPEVSKALEIDDQLASGLISRALLLTDFEWNWGDAARDYRKALELDPNSTRGHHWYALHQAQLGRTSEALEEIGLAQKQDPLAAIIRAARAKILLMAHRFPEAIAQSQNALEIEANFPPAYSVLAQALAFDDRHAEAVSAAQKYVELAGDGDQERLELAFIYAATGKRDEAHQIASEVESRAGNFSKYDMAAINLALGDKGAALRWLQASIEQRAIDAVWLRVDPRFDALRSDPGFQQVVSALKPRHR